MENLRQTRHSLKHMRLRYSLFSERWEMEINTRTTLHIIFSFSLCKCAYANYMLMLTIHIFNSIMWIKSLSNYTLVIFYVPKQCT